MIVMTEEQAMKLAKEVLGAALEVDEFKAMDCAHQVIILGYAIFVIGVSSIRAVERERRHE